MGSDSGGLSRGLIPLEGRDLLLYMTHMTPAEARQIVTILLSEHNLYGWNLKFGTAKKQAGYCSYANKTINLSKTLMAARTYEGTMDTIRHEIAHALTRGDGHGSRWQTKFKELGGNGERLWTGDTLVKPEAVQGIYEGTCPGCGRKVNKHRMPSRITSCGKCSSVFNPQFILKWTKNGRPIIVVDKPRQRRSSRGISQRSWV
jgi:predicted SprT family Zn-dependent metalloprotease